MKVTLETYLKFHLGKPAKLVDHRVKPEYIGKTFISATTFKPNPCLIEINMLEGDSDLFNPNILVELV
jgi:hypothetical protein